MKRIIIVMMFVFLLTCPINADEVLDPNIPESWYYAPKQASELGLTEFSQSPMLDKKVENGILPPVEKRLPDDPPVIEPYENIGKYGGTANTWGTSIDQWFTTDAWLLQPLHGRLGRATPDGQDEVPYLAKGWEYSNDKKDLTLYLRPGLKWSDGYLFTADDYIYWYEHIAKNKDLSPVPPEEWKPWGLINVEKIDKYTVKFEFNKPNPTRHHEFHIWCGWGVVQPKHYMKQFHIDFRDKEELMKEVKEAGFDYWYEYYQYMNTDTIPERTRPTLRPFVAVEKTASYLLAERNPYYPFVDTEGNQLPYIDKLCLNLANEAEMMSMKSVTGEATISTFGLNVSDIPLYKNNQEKGNYDIRIFTSMRNSYLAIQPNFNHQNKAYRKIMQDFRFRKALSLSIDRNEINEKLFYGLAVPRQTTTIPTSKFFKQEFADSYIQYDPETAKQLLNEIGLKDINGDNYRELPNGEPFNPTLIYVDLPGQDPTALEMIVDDFAEIGINLDLQMLNWGLFIQRKGAYNFDMSQWQISRAVDLLFPRAPYDYAPTWPGGHGVYTQWPAWHHWYETSGKEGEEPPEEIKRLIELAETMASSTKAQERLKAAEKLLEAQANNLWTIGTIGLDPVPIIVKNNLKNVPLKGFFADEIQYLDSYYPIQFYLDE